MLEDLNFPKLWLICKLSNCLELNQSGVWGDDARNDGSDFPILRSTNIQDRKLILEDVAYKSIQPKLAERYVLQTGDILVTKSSGSIHLVGKNAIFESTKNGQIYLFSNFTQRLRVNAKLALPYYIYFYLNSVYCHNFIERMHSTTSGLRNLDMKLYALQKIPLPPLPEQKRIVAILREADELLRLRWQANEKTQNLLPAIFYEMFQSPAEWKKTISLEKLVRFVGGGTPNRKIQRYFQGNIPWVTSKDMGSRYLNDTQEHITEEAIKNSATNLVPDGTILIVVKSKILVRLLPIGITTRPVCFGQDIKGLICKPDVKPQFIAAALSAQARHILNQARGVNTEGLNLEILRKIQIPDVDPSKQEEFTQRVIEYDQIEQSLFNFAQKSESLFQSLLAQAFAGELTATWREQHQEELVAVAAERDRLLQISQPVNVEELADEAVSETKRGELHSDRDELLRNLSKSQWKIYESVIQETAYFTPERLEEKYSIPRNIGHKSLQLLAAAGLIVPVTLPTPTSSGLRYELAYRNLNQDDDTLYSDVALLKKDVV